MRDVTCQLRRRLSKHDHQIINANFLTSPYRQLKRLLVVALAIAMLHLAGVYVTAEGESGGIWSLPELLKLKLRISCL